MSHQVTDPDGVTHVDRIDDVGNITQHRVSAADPTRTKCGAKLGMTQAPAGNRPCRNCYPVPRPRAS